MRLARGDDYPADEYRAIERWPDGWPGTPKTRWRTDPRRESVIWCGRTRALGVDRTSRTGTTWLWRCKSWDCPRCGVEKATRHLLHLYALFGEQDCVWYGYAKQGTRKVCRATTQRARRRARRLGEDLGMVVIRNRDGGAHFFSTHDATDGKTVLGEALRPEAARKVLREKALVVGQIGSWGVSYSDRWREPVEGHKGNSVYIGAGSAEEVDRAEELANRRIRREYGETIPPLDVVVAIYEEALCEARSSRGRGRG